jgi:hypothetical protein
MHVTYACNVAAVALTLLLLLLSLLSLCQVLSAAIATGFLVWGLKITLRWVCGTHSQQHTAVAVDSRKQAAIDSR